MDGKWGVKAGRLCRGNSRKNSDLRGGWLVWARMIATVRGVVCSQFVMFVTLYILLSSVGFVFLDRQCGLVVQSLRDRESCVRHTLSVLPHSPSSPPPCTLKPSALLVSSVSRKKRNN